MMSVVRGRPEVACRPITDDRPEVHMAAAEIDFWLTIGSTYSFLSVMRLGNRAVYRDQISLGTISPSCHSTRNEERPVRRQDNQICLHVWRHRRLRGYV